MKTRYILIKTVDREILEPIAYQTYMDALLAMIKSFVEEFLFNEFTVEDYLKEDDGCNWYVFSDSAYLTGKYGFYDWVIKEIEI